jgi:hypothetical protein
MHRYARTLPVIAVLLLMSVRAPMVECPMGDTDRNCNVDFTDQEQFAGHWLGDANSPGDFCRR